MSNEVTFDDFVQHVTDYVNERPNREYLADRWVGSGLLSRQQYLDEVMARKLVVVPEALYRELTYDAAKLNALEQVGVDNWEGYEEAMTFLKEVTFEEGEKPYVRGQHE